MSQLLDGLMPLEQAASPDELDCSVRTLLRWEQAGLIEIIRIKRRLYLDIGKTRAKLRGEGGQPPGPRRRRAGAQ